MPSSFRDPRQAIEAAAARVARQREMVHSLLRRGLPTRLAVEFLTSMERILTTLRSIELDRPAAAIRTLAQNHLLARLGADDIECVSGTAQLVEFASGDVLMAPRAPIDAVWFIESGIVAAIGGDMDRPVEVATIGREGAVGAEVILGTPANPLGYVALFGGQALRVDAAVLARVARDAPLVDTLLRYNEVLHVQSASAAVAGARYTIDQRLARSLLMYQDRADGDELDVTHTTLAEKLAVRRAGVTDALHRLEGDRLIRAHRSSIVIRDRDGLESKAGDSYGFAEATYRSLFPVPIPAGPRLEPATAA